MNMNQRKRGGSSCGFRLASVGWFKALLFAAAVFLMSAQGVLAAGSITGTITGPSGPVSGSYVGAINSATGAFVANSSISAADGSYTISGLAAGTYKAYNYTHTTSPGLSKSWYENSYDFNTARPVTVTDGGTATGINFTPVNAGGIMGTITNGGSPVSGLVVNAYFVHDDGSTVAWGPGATTNGSGIYSISGLPPGKYKVAVNPGSTSYAMQYYTGADSFITATPVTVAAGATASGIDFSLVTGGKISGTVRNADTTNPVQGAWVAVFDEMLSAQVPFSAATAADGTYTTCALPAGKYRMIVGSNSEPGYVATWYNNNQLNMASTPVTVAAGATTSGIDYNLAANAAAITGTVTRLSDGQPLPGMLVRALSKGPLGQQVKSATTAWDGTYSITGLPPGDYRVYANPQDKNYAGVYYNNAFTLSTASLVSVGPSETKNNINFILPRGGYISGGAANDGTPLPGMLVRVSDPSGSTNVGYNVFTQYDGSYTITGLPAGTYFVRAYAPVTDVLNNYLGLFYNNVARRNSGTGVAVVTNETTSAIDFNMPLGGKVAGTVTSASGGAPIAALAILAYDETTGSQMAAVSTSIVDGSYVLTGLPAGNYRIMAFAEGSGYASGWYSSTGTVPNFASATSISVSVGSTTTGIHFQLQTDELLYAHFAGNGIWKYNGASWDQASANNPEDMVISGSVLYGDFGGGGIWKYDGSNWTSVTPNNPQMMAAATSLYASFAGAGVWKYNGFTWSQITTNAPDKMNAGGSSLYATFSGTGIWKHDGADWTNITLAEPTMMAATNSLVFAAFAGTGIWKYDGTGWTNATPAEPTRMAASGTKLYAQFSGSGIWLYDAGSWTQVTSNESTMMTTAGSRLFADFTGGGIWKYSGSWSQTTSNDPTRMVAGN